MIKAAIYDMDDLMIKSDPLHAMAWEKVLEEFNHKFSDMPEAQRSRFIGMRVIDICKDIIEELKLDIDLESFYKKRIEIFLDIVKNDLETMPGLLRSLELFKQNDYSIALASSGADQYISLVLDRFEIRSYFNTVVSGDCVNIGKPHPETYIVAAKKLGCKPAECLVLEDAKNGIDSAVDAGCKCIAIVNPNTPVQDHSRANLILNSLDEITLEVVEAL